MATSIENNYVADGSTVLYSFTFPYINEPDVRVSLNSVPTTEYTLANPTTVQLDAPPATGVAIRVYRVTDVDAPEATFFPGSVIRASDLNDNFVQNIYATQESQSYIENSDAAQVKDTADTALENANTALAAAQDAQSSADDADAKADNAIVIASTKVDRTSATGSAAIPAGSTSERDGTPQEGYLRYNTVTDTFEGYTNVGWGAIAGGGGDVEEAPEDGNQYARQDGDWSLITGGGEGGTTNITEYSGASAWGSVKSDGTLNGGLNCTVTQTSQGFYAISFLTPMPSAVYSVQVDVSGGYNTNQGANARPIDLTSTGFTVQTTDFNANVTNIDFTFTVFSQNALPPKSGTGTDAWGSVAGDGTLGASFNVASVTKTGTGAYDVVFSSPMPTADYAVTATPQEDTGRYVYANAKTTTGFHYEVLESTGTRSDRAVAFTVNATNATLPLTFSSEQIEAAINNPGLSAWASVEEDGTLLSGLNTASVTNVSTGKYDVVFATPMPDANYAVSFSFSDVSNKAFGQVGGGTKTTTGFRAEFYNTSAGDAGGSWTYMVAATNALPPKGGTGTDAWGNIEADGTLAASFNVASVTKIGTGQYAVLFTIPMPSANYSVVGSSYGSGAATVFTAQSITAAGFTAFMHNSSSYDSPVCFQVNATNAVLPQAFTEQEVQQVVDLAKSGATNPGASAWGNIAPDGTLNNGLNVASVTKTGTGQYVVAFKTPLPNADYSVNSTTVYTGQATVGITYILNQSATGFQIDTLTYTGSAADYGVNFTVFATNSVPLKGGTGTDCWGSVDEDGTLEAGFNVASVTRTGTGVYDVVFTTPMPTGTYSVVASAERPSGGPSINITNKSASGFTVSTYNTAPDLISMPFNFQVNATNAVLPQSFTEAQIQSVLDFIAVANPAGVARAWGVFNGTGGISDFNGLNSSVTRIGTGEYDVVFNTPMPSDNYSVSLSVGDSPNINRIAVVDNDANPPTNNGFRIHVGSADASNANDNDRVSYVIYAN